MASFIGGRFLDKKDEMSVQYGNNIYLAPSPVVPPFLLISNITQATNAVVTVTTANQYVAGQRVYFSVPFTYGMFQINGLSSTIQAVDVTNLIFTMDISTILFDAFIVPVSGEQPATLSPSGAHNLYNVTTVPFHALDGTVGN